MTPTDPPEARGWADPPPDSPPDAAQPDAGETAAASSWPMAAGEPADGVARTLPAEPETSATWVGTAPAWTGTATVGTDTVGDASRPRSRRRRAAARVAGGAAAVVLLVAVFAGGVAVDRSGILGGPAARPEAVDPTQFSLVQEAWDLLRTQYVGARQMDPTTVAYGAIQGMTQAIGDTGHTDFLTPAERKANAAELSGTYVGIGVELDIKDGTPIISGVIHGGPSEAAGLQAGDLITKVDGKATQDQPLDAIASEIRGTAGTPVVLTIARTGAADPLTFRIVRAEIKLPPVDSAMVPGTTLGMIRVEQFSTGAGDQFASQLKSLLAQHPTGLILDLRGNPGGYVGEAVSIASQFLTSGNVYITRDASGKETPAPVKPGALAPTIPLVVLVDGGTASSAEIVAGALADAGRARTIGTTTFGTGTVVAEFPLADGSALRIGTVEWLTPKGHQIWHHGITPDVAVTLPTDVRTVTPTDLPGLGASGVAATKDAQLQKAIELLSAP